MKQWVRLEGMVGGQVLWVHIFSLAMCQRSVVWGSRPHYKSKETSVSSYYIDKCESFQNFSSRRFINGCKLGWKY